MAGSIEASRHGRSVALRRSGDVDRVLRSVLLVLGLRRLVGHRGRRAGNHLALNLLKSQHTRLLLLLLNRRGSRDVDVGTRKVGLNLVKRQDLARWRTSSGGGLLGRRARLRHGGSTPLVGRRCLGPQRLRLLLLVLLGRLCLLASCHTGGRILTLRGRPRRVEVVLGGSKEVHLSLGVEVALGRGNGSTGLLAVGRGRRRLRRELEILACEVRQRYSSKQTSHHHALKSPTSPKVSSLKSSPPSRRPVSMPSPQL